MPQPLAAIAGAGVVCNPSPPRWRTHRRRGIWIANCDQEKIKEAPLCSLASISDDRRKGELHAFGT